MSIWLRLLLGHLAGDFIFQPGPLVVLKRQRQWGVALHSAIVVLVTALLLWQDLAHWWFWFVLLGISHALIDQLRVSVIKDAKGKGLYLLLLDQLAHLSFITAFAVLSGRWRAGDFSLLFSGPNVTENRLMVFLIALVFLIFTVPILELEASSTPISAGQSGNDWMNVQISLRDRALGGFERLGAMGLILVGFPYLAPLALVPRLYWQRAEWRHSPTHRWFLSKVATSFLCAIVMGLILLPLVPF